MLIPIILGSDKTTVSVATGDNEYYPLYLSIGNVHNSVRRAHRNALVLVGFLAIPKSTSLTIILCTVPSLTDFFMFTLAEKQYKNDVRWRKFRRQLFHSSLSAILEPLRSGMSTPEIIRCPDGHFRRAIYDLAVYIADYPEQVLATCIVQGWCPMYVYGSLILIQSNFAPLRCDADHNDLNQNASRRSRRWTEGLIEELDLGTLWEDFGIVGDITVCCICDIIFLKFCI